MSGEAVSIVSLSLTTRLSSSYVSPLSTHLILRARSVNLILNACRHIRAPPTPKKNAVGISMKPAEGVISTRPAIAPMNVESRDHLPVSQYVKQDQVKAPALAHKLVTHMAMTDLKFKDKVVPASKANHDPQMMT